MRLVPVLVVVSLAGGICGCVALPRMTPDAVQAESSPSRSRVAAPPAGFTDFCERAPVQCPAATGPVARLSFNGELWDVLTGVNAAINHAIAPVDDKAHYGMNEYWTIPVDGYGDCDDYVLTKRRALIDAGVSESALRIAIVFTSRFVRHTVLIVATDRGNYVLDNLRSEIVTWDKTEYGWIKGQDPASRSGWAYF
jgi:predicted transglutaminase-like cysteine proteinase